MSKTQFYLSQCADAASKSPMCFTLGAVLVKGGKVISSGYNHHRPHYDGAEVPTRGHRKPVSMHAEMHAIFSLTGMSPSFRKQRQGAARVGAGAGTVSPQLQTPCFARAPPPPPTPPPRSSSSSFKGEAPLATCEGHPHRRVQRVAGAGFGLPSTHGQAVLVF
jgi:pyrimidine deaminase RibD-like protein